MLLRVVLPGLNATFRSRCRCSITSVACATRPQCGCSCAFNASSRPHTAPPGSLPRMPAWRRPDRVRPPWDGRLESAPGGGAKACTAIALAASLPRCSATVRREDGAARCTASTVCSQSARRTVVHTRRCCCSTRDSLQTQNEIPFAFAHGRHRQSVPAPQQREVLELAVAVFTQLTE